MGHQKIILLADSSREFCWLMQMIAKQYNYLFMTTVGTGRDVLLSTRKQMPDLLLMDISLPDISGLTVLEKLAQQVRAPKTIFLSSMVSNRLAERALKLGALYFIPKPFHADALFDIIYNLFYDQP